MAPIRPRPWCHGHRPLRNTILSFPWPTNWLWVSQQWASSMVSSCNLHQLGSTWYRNIGKLWQALASSEAQDGETSQGKRPSRSQHRMTSSWCDRRLGAPGYTRHSQHEPAWLCTFVELHAVLCARRGTECCTRRRCGLSLQQRMNPGMESSKLGRKGKQDRHGEEMHVCSKDVPKRIKMRQHASTCIKMYQTSTKISQRRDIEREIHEDHQANLWMLLLLLRCAQDQDEFREIMTSPDIRPLPFCFPFCLWTA